MYMAATWGMLKVLSGLFLGKIPNALQANHPGIAVELGPDDGRRDDVGRGPASAGEGQFWRAAAAVRHTGHGNSLATAAIRRCSAGPISFLGQGRRAPDEIVPRDPAAPRVGKQIRG